MSFLDTNKISSDMNALYNILGCNTEECSKSMEKYGKFFGSDDSVTCVTYGSGSLGPTGSNLSISRTSSAGSTGGAGLRTMSRTHIVASSAKRSEARVHPLCPF